MLFVKKYINNQMGSNQYVKKNKCLLRSTIECYPNEYQAGLGRLKIDYRTRERTATSHDKRKEFPDVMSFKDSIDRILFSVSVYVRID